MRELGYVEGQNLVIEAKWLEGTASPREEAAKATAELARSKMDVFVAQGAAIDGVKIAAGSTPVVFGYSGDPVEAKIVASLARPGGNLTGITVFAAIELAGKQLQWLKEAFPSISRVGVLVNPLHIGEYPEFQQAQSVAQRLNITLQQSIVRTVPEINAALETMVRERVQALMVFPNLLTMSQRHVIADFATKHRIPTISAWEDFAVDGNLMTYGPDLRESWRYAATYVDKILKGAKPADLPVEQPTRLLLVINLKAANALGVTIPASLLARADRLIE
jgi:putative ABC transport system substrate-binding protein